MQHVIERLARAVWTLVDVWVNGKRTVRRGIPLLVTLTPPARAAPMRPLSVVRLVQYVVLPASFVREPQPAAMQAKSDVAKGAVTLGRRAVETTNAVGQE